MVQGLSDIVVWKINSEQVVTSFAKTLDLIFGIYFLFFINFVTNHIKGNGTAHGYITDVPTTTTPGQVPDGRNYTTYTYANSQDGII